MTTAKMLGICAEVWLGVVVRVQKQWSLLDSNQ